MGLSGGDGGVGAGGCVGLAVVVVAPAHYLAIGAQPARMKSPGGHRGEGSRRRVRLLVFPGYLRIAAGVGRAGGTAWVFGWVANGWSG